MNQALEVFYYILEKTFNFLFGAYLFDGVSIGMIGIVGFIFTILLHYLLAVPKMQVADYRPVKTWVEKSDTGNIIHRRKVGR